MTSTSSTGLLRTITRRARNAVRRLRPFPMPKYVAGTPKVGNGHRLDLYLPPTAETLGAAAMSEEACDRVRQVLGTLTPCESHEASIVRYAFGRAKFGLNWRYADLLTTVCAAATLLRPANYLEIGVWRGRSAAAVANVWPPCDIYGFDLWLPGYHGVENPGPDFVRGELCKAGHQGNVTLVSGDSRRTLPAFLREHPALFFDLITIDGDKSVAGWASDLANALPRLKLGGVVLTDDLPGLPSLRRVWDKMIRRSIRYVNWEFIDAGFGVAAAIRVAD